MQSPRRKRTSHSRAGCATCRQRRVLCDERKDTCANCARLGLSCTWYRPTEMIPRSRSNAACKRCRAKKIKCTSAGSTASCEPCYLARVICANASQPSPALSTTDNGESVTPTSAVAFPIQLPERAELRRLLDAYFAGPQYHCFYNFIHQPTFEQMVDSGQAHKPLLLIVLATSLHFIEPDNHLADEWADECRRLVMLDIFSPPSTTTLQTLLLFQRYEWHRASHISAWLIAGLAVRLAHGLQLNIEISDEACVPVAVRETRRRLMWSCFIMDSLIENGRNPLSGLDVSSIEVKVPCNESSFHLALETNFPDLEHLYDWPMSSQQGALGPHSAASVATSPENRLGISAFLVKLAELRRDILNWTLPYHPRNKSHFPSQLPWVLGSPFYHFKTELENWYMHLPEELRFNSDVLHRRRFQLVSLMTLHCLFNGCYCDLYRIGSYLTPSQRLNNANTAFPTSPESFLTTCRRGRLQNALDICKVIAQSMEHQCSEYDPVVGISAALAMRVLVIERQREDSDALGFTEEAIYTCLDPAVQCARWIARRSVPIRDLFFSICALARKRGFYVDLSGISADSSLSYTARQERERESSPSLRTYGTFGRIQSSLAARGDVNALAASSTTDKESDLFNNFESFSANSKPLPERDAQVQSEINGLYPSARSMSLHPGEDASPSNTGIASGWGDGTLNFSMMPLQFDWINQSLGYNFDNNTAYSTTQDMW